LLSLNESGGTGSWGQELTRNLLVHNPKEIRIFSKDEFSQVYMQQAFNNNSCL
jgi:UDP-N-acetylglucosamine 4,6-dehydratase/5-epimerase